MSDHAHQPNMTEQQAFNRWFMLAKTSRATGWAAWRASLAYRGIEHWQTQRSRPAFDAWLASVRHRDWTEFDAWCAAAAHVAAQAASVLSVPEQTSTADQAALAQEDRSC